MGDINDYRDAIEAQVSGEHDLAGQDAMDSAIAKAMREHSKHSPQVVVEDIAGADTFAYDLSGLAAWEDDFSQIREIEYPVDDNSAAKDILEEGDWRVYTRPTGRQLHLLADEPATGESIRVAYTARHTCDESSCTVPAAEEDAVQVLAASYFCEIVAGSYAQNMDATIQADSVDQQSMRREYSGQARAFRREYEGLMNITPGRPKAASHTQDQDLDSGAGRDRLTHPRRSR